MVSDDIFESGLARRIGPHAFLLWMAIKKHADYATGECWPGYRHLTDITGLAPATIKKCLDILTTEKLLRICGKRRQQNIYIARERLDVTLGSQTVCMIVMDYIPGSLRANLKRIEEGFKTGEHDPDFIAQLEIIPGPGFRYDTSRGTFIKEIPVRNSTFTHFDPEAQKRGEAFLDDIRRKQLAKA